MKSAFVCLVGEANSAVLHGHLCWFHPLEGCNIVSLPLLYKPLSAEVLSLRNFFTQTVISVAKVTPSPSLSFRSIFPSLRRNFQKPKSEFANYSGIPALLVSSLMALTLKKHVCQLKLSDLTANSLTHSSIVSPTSSCMSSLHPRA